MTIKRFILASTILLASCGASVPALAQNAAIQTLQENFEPYVALSLGGCIIDRNNIVAEECQQFTGAVGAQLTPNISADLAYNVLNSDFTELNGASNAAGDYGRTEWSVNAYYHFDIERYGFQPYVGAGYGVGEINTDFVGTADHDPTIKIFADHSEANAFWDVKFGVERDLTRAMTGFTEFAYRSYADNGIVVNYETTSGTTGQLGGADGVKGLDRSYDLRIGVKLRLR